MTKNAVALISGGMDSAVAGAMAREQGHRIFALSFDYGQRHRIELEAAAKVAAWLEAPDHKIVRVQLEAFGGSALTDRIEVRKNGLGPDLPATYVPARNIVFLSIALAWAETIEAGTIVIGANAIDFSGYPDCRPEFMEAFQKTAETGTRAGLQGRAPFIYAPLMNMTKAQIVKQGIRLGLDFAITASCYDPDPKGKPCGKCDACRLRAKGFAEANCKDPVSS